MRFSIWLAAGALVLSGASAFAQDAGGPKGNADNGHKDFMTFGCWQCHGEAGQGAVATGPHIAKTALPYESFANQLRHPASEMPPYEAAVVTDAQVADLYAYVQSLPGPVDPKTTPLLANMGVK